MACKCKNQESEKRKGGGDTREYRLTVERTVAVILLSLTNLMQYMLILSIIFTISASCQATHNTSGRGRWGGGGR